ncbi:UNVERIFIED_CONTAM: hypothetical protein GTU68_013036, partial [Idotea baltica]|nr:hypothetical protein [Idotea baltica]
MIPLSLYIHIPWCEKKCPYCDFNSHQAKENIDEASYIDTLLLDLKNDLKHYGNTLKDRPIQTIFIGGGTPSLFSPDSISTLLSGIREQIYFADNVEITLEANPGSSEVEKFKGFRDTGINRLSIGVQSFNPIHLKALGRVHNCVEAIAAANAAHRAGFDNFNLDLMFGLPEQSTQQSLADLQQALELKPTHLSCYQLTIEPNTLFHHNPPITPGDETLWDMQQALQATLNEYGYSQYEVSAYAQENRQCRHNLNYWQFGDYLGIGAGAHGKITDLSGLVERSWKIKHPSSYLQKNEKLGARQLLDSDQLPFEFMMNALRLNSGFSVDLFQERTTQSINAVSKIIDRHHKQGLV